MFESACVLRAIPDRNPSQSITNIHHNSSQFIAIHHNPSQSIAIHRNPSQRQARWYQVQYQVGYQVGYQDGHHRIGIRFELTHKHKCSINRNRIGAYLLAARRLSVRSGGFGDVLQTDRG